MSAGFISKGALGPWLYWETRIFALHLVARYFKRGSLAAPRGFFWRISLRVGWRGNGRYVVFWGNS